jgi:hypothetical protein
MECCDCGAEECLCDLIQDEIDCADIVHGVLVQDID